MIVGERMEMFTILCYFARHVAGGCPGELEFADYATFLPLEGFTAFTAPPFYAADLLFDF
jgi:hypothetical protein